MQDERHLLHMEREQVERKRTKEEAKAANQAESRVRISKSKSESFVVDGDSVAEIDWEAVLQRVEGGCDPAGAQISGFFFE